MNTEKYSMSFTTGALFHLDSVNIAGLYLEKGDWNEVRDEVISRNILQGLDIFQHYEMNEALAFANRLQQYRPCKAFEVTYLRL